MSQQAERNDPVQELFDRVRHRLGVAIQNEHLTLALRRRSENDPSAVQRSRVAEWHGDKLLADALASLLHEYALGEDLPPARVEDYDNALKSFNSNKRLADRGKALGLDKWMREFASLEQTPLFDAPTNDAIADGMEMLIAGIFESNGRDQGGHEPVKAFVRRFVFQPNEPQDSGVFPLPVSLPGRSRTMASSEQYERRQSLAHRYQDWSFSDLFDEFTRCSREQGVEISRIPLSGGRYRSEVRNKNGIHGAAEAETQEKADHEALLEAFVHTLPRGHRRALQQA